MLSYGGVGCTSRTRGGGGAWLGWWCICDGLGCFVVVVATKVVECCIGLQCLWLW